MTCWRKCGTTSVSLECMFVLSNQSCVCTMYAPTLPPLPPLHPLLTHTHTHTPVTPNPRASYQTIQLQWYCNKLELQWRTSVITFTRVSLQNSNSKNEKHLPAVHWSGGGVILLIRAPVPCSALVWGVILLIRAPVPCSALVWGVILLIRAPVPCSALVWGVILLIRAPVPCSALVWGGVILLIRAPVPCSALVWGSSVKHNPQNVGKEHILNDEDVVQIVKK